ncbi:hypothetical protein ABFA25_02480 [Mycobacterium lepromatosis]
MQFVWITLGALALTDFYIMLVANSTITKIGFVGLEDGRNTGKD